MRSVTVSTRSAERRSVVRSLLGVAWCATLLVACTDGTGTRDAGSGDAVVSSVASTAGAPAPTSSVAATPSTVPEPTTAPALPLPPPAPEPTGVPGLDDPDPLCASWAVYSGTVQAIGIAGAFGDLGSADVAVLESMAAKSVADAITDIAGRWPSELIGERSAVLDELLGPFGRRADKALAALRAAGATDDDIGQLGTAWLAALRARDPQNPVIEVPAAGERLAAIVVEAAAAFDAAVTPFANDPSLEVDEVEVPLTDAYLATHCLDLASIGVGDAV